MDRFRGRLTQVVLNLLTNIQRYAYPGGMGGRVETSIGETQPAYGPAFVVVVRDFGRGISADAVPSVFDPFFATGRGLGGTCLGMAIVHNSVKTNIGHLEAAAGIAGPITVALAMKNAMIPFNCHSELPNPAIPFDDFHIRVPTEPISWPETGAPPVAGVSSFGFSGTNCHVVVQGSPLDSLPPRMNGAAGYEILTLSARSAESVRELARSTAVLARDDPQLNLSDLCYSAARRRDHGPHRLALVSSSLIDAAETLQEFADNDSTPNSRLSHGLAALLDRAQVVFDFSDADLERESMLGEVARLYCSGVPIAWEQLYTAGRFVRLPAYPWNRRRYWIDDDQAPTPAPATRVEVQAQLRTTSPAERRAVLSRHVREQIAATMALDSADGLAPRRSFSDLGVDSLTATEAVKEFEEALGRSFPPTLLFEHPMVECLTAYLQDQLFPQPVPVPSTQRELDVRALSDAEAEQLLLAELAAIDGGQTA